MPHDFSISFLTYNNENIVYDNLSNLVKALPQELSCILYVIDNASTDGTLSEIRRFKADLARLEYVQDHVTFILIANPTNIGYGRGHNILLQRLTSRYHLVMNPDIRIDGTDQLSSMVQYLEDHPDAGLLVPKLLNLDASVQHLCKKNPTLVDLMIRRFPLPFLHKRQQAYVMMESGYDHAMEVEYASGCFMLFRTRLFCDLGGFDERFFLYLEDADITRRINEVSKTLFYPRVSVYHGWYRGTYRNPKLFLINLHSVYLYFSKWGWRLW